MASQRMEILVSAGEASGDLYASELVAALRERLPAVHFFGCAGERMKAAGVEPVVDSASLSVVGIVEVIGHIPRIYGEFRKLIAAARARRPVLAILTDSPDFNLRVARKLRALGIPVVHLIAPQAWAWRKSRVKAMRRDLDRLLCIFPFEQDFFREHGIDAHYIGNPLTRIVRTSQTAEAFFAANALDPARPLVTLLPGSRRGEIARHMPVLAETVRRLAASNTTLQFALALPNGLISRHGRTFFEEPISGLSIQIVEGQTWDAMARSRLLLAASGTVTTEAAILGTPMVAFYKVKPSTWLLFRRFVDVPHFTMVNLVADWAATPEERLVLELIQNEMTAERLSTEAMRLLMDDKAREEMIVGLAGVRNSLATGQDPIDRAAELVMEVLETTALKTNALKDAHAH